METLGLRNQCLVVNAVFHATQRDDPVAVAWEDEARSAAMPETLRALSRTTVPLHGQNIVGIVALRALFTASVGPEPRVAAGARSPHASASASGNPG